MTSPHRTAARFIIGLLTLTGATLAVAQPTACSRPGTTLTLPDSAVASLAGTYRIELFADHPRISRVAGDLTLWTNFEEHVPLLGRAYIALDSVGGTFMIPRGSFDAWRHDVFGVNFNDGLVLTVGRPVVRGGKMTDGNGTDLRLRARTANGFSGTWSASSGPTTYRADGYFCATRLKPGR